MANWTRWPAWQARIASPVARWVFPVPGGPRRTTFSLRGDEVQGAQVRDGLSFQAAGVVVVEVLQALAGGEPGGADPSLAAVGLPGGHLALQAGGEELLMGPGLLAGAFGQPLDRLPQRGCLQRPGQELQLAGDITPGLPRCVFVVVRVAIRHLPSTTVDRVDEAEDSVVDSRVSGSRPPRR